MIVSEVPAGQGGNTRGATGKGSTTTTIIKNYHRRPVLIKIAAFFGFEIAFEYGNMCRITTGDREYVLPIERCERKLYRLGACANGRCGDDEHP